MWKSIIYKMGVLNLWCFSLLGLSIVASAYGKGVLMCYYGSWATYLPEAGRFETSHIDTSLCTHLVYTFVGLNEDGTIQILDPYLDLPDDWGRDNFRKFNDLKENNPDLKTLLAIGGWNEGSAKFSKVMNNPALRTTFVRQATELVLKYGFDGFDMDWEYPNQRDSLLGEADVKAFTSMVKELKAAFKPHGLLLTAVVASVESMASVSYDIPAISEHIDLISIMAYDMYGGWNDMTGHNAPLHRGLGDEKVPRKRVLSVDVAVEYWLSQGAPPEKLLLGLPLYGRTFRLSSPTQTNLRSPTLGPGLGGPYTRQNGLLGYNEICELLSTGQWTMQFDELAKVPYAFNDRNWISYDDVNSLKYKTEFAIRHDLAGVMVWSIERDDFHGTCHQQKFPLLNAIKDAMNRKLPSSGINSVSATNTAHPMSSNQPNPSRVVEKPISSGLCKEEGYVRDPLNCGVFYYCQMGSNNMFVVHKFNCPVTLYWDVSLKTCNYSNLVKCET